MLIEVEEYLTVKLFNPRCMLSSGLIDIDLNFPYRYGIAIYKISPTDTNRRVLRTDAVIAADYAATAKSPMRSHIKSSMESKRLLHTTPGFCWLFKATESVKTKKMKH